MKYPVLLKIHSGNTVLCDADRIHRVVSENHGSNVFLPGSEYYTCKESVDEVYQKIQDALNPNSNSEALKHQNSQLIQVIDSTKAKIEAYKGEIEDIRDLVGANDDESAFYKVQRLHSKNNSLYIAFAGFFEKTIDLIPNDLVVEVQKTLNELKPCNSKS